MNRAAAWSLASLLLGGFATAQAVAADRYRFEPRVAAGDVFETNHQFVLKFLVPSSPELQDGDTSFTMGLVSKTRWEVLAVRSGKATDLRLTYLMRSMEMTTDGNKVAMNLPDVGRTFLIRKRKGKVVTTAEDGKVEDSTRSGLAEVLDSTGPIRFPKVDLAMGDEWDAPDAEDTTPGEIGQTRARLVGFLEQGGENQARIRVSKSKALGMLGIPNLSNASYIVRLEGELHYASARQRPVTMDLQGPIQFSGTFMKDGKEVPITGTGEGQEIFREKWIKIAGKPVAEPTPASSAR